MRRAIPTAVPTAAAPPSVYFDRHQRPNTSYGNPVHMETMRNFGPGGSRPSSAAPTPARPATSHGGYGSGTPGGGYGIGLDAAHTNYLQQMHQYQQYQQYQQTQQTHQMQQPMQPTQQPMQQHGYHQPQPAHPGFQYHQQARQQFHQPVTANDDFQATLARARVSRTPSPSSWRLPTAARGSGSTRVRRRAGTSTTIQTIATCRTRRISRRRRRPGVYPGERPDRDGDGRGGGVSGTAERSER